MLWVLFDVLFRLRLLLLSSPQQDKAIKIIFNNQKETFLQSTVSQSSLSMQKDVSAQMRRLCGMHCKKEFHDIIAPILFIPKCICMNPYGRIALSVRHQLSKGSR